jgi:hypothetical protein
MPQIEELAARLKVTEDELMDAVADTGYELVPSAEGAEMAGDEGPEEGMAEDEMAMEDDALPIGDEGIAAEEDMAIEEDMGAGPMGLPPLPGTDFPEGRPSESDNPRMKMKMLVMDASKKALQEGKRK